MTTIEAAEQGPTWRTHSCVPCSHSANTCGPACERWDRPIQARRVTWINPVTGLRYEQIGRWNAKELVQIGTHADRTAIRWFFIGITPDSFHWTGEVLEPDGKTWGPEGEFRTRRKR